MDNIISSKDILENFKPKQLSSLPEEKKRKKLVIAIPGDSFSSKFLISWTSLLNTLWSSGEYDIVVSPGVSSFVTFARMQTLGVDVRKGIQQKPFNGLDFDYFLSIDSDIIFSPQHVLSLLEGLETHPVVAGLYRMVDLTSYAIVKDWDTDYFIKNGKFEFLTPDYVEKWKSDREEKYMSVSYTGMGFFAIKAEVLKKMIYPYFDSSVQEIITEDGTIMRELVSEDVAFCKNITKLGYNIMIDTDIRVGHLKALVI